ncbi:hypothetical protein M9458_051182 [Cirrhinus mrigala]|uniref:Uncharacterized protein n=1 Tax=Cirrhinus mrigala TaxID=683832 RepID=A0ABD0MWE1_CIRMR
MCTSNRDGRKLENTDNQNQFKHLGELHKEWNEAGVSASRVTTLRRLQEKDYQATSETETTSEIKVNFAFHVEIMIPESGGRQERHRIQAAGSPVKFPKSLMIWGAVASAGVGALCFIKYKVNAAVYQEILEHFMLPSADKLYEDADFLFQQDFSTCPQCKNHFQVFC